MSEAHTPRGLRIEKGASAKEALVREVRKLDFKNKGIKLFQTDEFVRLDFLIGELLKGGWGVYDGHRREIKRLGKKAKWEVNFELRKDVEENVRARKALRFLGYRFLWKSVGYKNPYFKDGAPTEARVLTIRSGFLKPYRDEKGNLLLERKRKEDGKLNGQMVPIPSNGWVEIDNGIPVYKQGRHYTPSNKRRKGNRGYKNQPCQQRVASRG